MTLIVKPLSAQIKNEGYFLSDACSLYYKTIGSGRTLIILHGGPGLDHSYFLPQLAEFTDEYNLVFFDLRGCGLSCTELEASDISLNKFADDVENLRKFLKLDKVEILSHSFGTLVAMNYAARYPEQVKSMVLMNPTPASSAWRDSSFAMMSRRHTMEETARLDSIKKESGFASRDAAVMSRFFRTLFRSSFYDQRFADSLNIRLNKNYPRTAKLMDYLNNDPSMQSYNYLDSLKNFRKPVLIIGAEADMIPPLALEEMHRTLKNSQYIFLESCGHFSFIEQPEAVRLALRRFYGKY